MKGAVFLVILLTCGFLKADVEPKSKVVKISQGLVKGYKSSKWDFYVFYGIPYATEPKGRDRYKAPSPGPIWMNTFEAVTENIGCPQENVLSNYNLTMVQNCLIANVYVPDTEETNIPVVVMVHGGGYQYGNAEFWSPKSMVHEGKFIYVTFNYRLGVHGFLCLGTEDVPGNAAMKDMVALLRWVKENIAKFGGNPSDVTIDGFSAGASAAELLMLSETSWGLFNKMITQSGSNFNAWSIQQNPLQAAETYAQILQFETNDFYKLQEFYLTASMDKLFSITTLLREDSGLYFMPCVERDTGSETFLKETPLSIYKSGKFPKLPTLIGISNAEGLNRADLFSLWKDKMNDRFSDFLPIDLKFSSDEEKEAVAKSVKEFYFGDNLVSEETVQSYIDFFSDVFFSYGVVKSVQQQVIAGSDSVYFYEYTYVDELEPRKLPNVIGAGHSMQSLAVYEFDYFSPMMSEVEKSTNYSKVKAQLRKIWINFIKSGRPVPNENSSNPERWPTASSEGVPYMRLDLTPELKTSRMMPERVRFWDEIYARYRSTPVPPPTPPPKHQINDTPHNGVEYNSVIGYDTLFIGHTLFKFNQVCDILPPGCQCIANGNHMFCEQYYFYQ